MVQESLGTDSSPAASIDELSGQTLLAGGVWVIASSALPQIYVLASSILIARFLSVDDMGLQSFIAFVSASVIFVCSFGVSGSLIRFGGELVGRNELDRLRGLVWWTAKIQLAGALIAGAIMVTIALFSHDQVLWLWGAAGSAIGTIVNVPASVLFVLRRWREASVITLTIGLAYTVAIAIVLSLGWGLAGVFGIGTILGAIAAVWTSRLAWRHLQAVAPRSGPHAALHRPLLGYAATIWAGFLLTTIVMRRSEFFFLERYSTTKAIAYYSVAFAVIAGFGSAVEALAGVVAPTVASLRGSDEMSRVGPAFSRAIRLVLLVSLPIAALGTIFGPPAIRVVYGSDYARTAGPLRIMLVPFPLLALMTLCGGLLWGSGRVRLWLLVFCFAAVVDISLDFILVPHLAEIGAAIANTSAQVTAAVLVLGYTARSFGPVDWQARVLARAVAAAVLAAAAGWLVVETIGGAAGVAIGATVAVAAFAGLSRVLRTVPAIDGAWITTSVRGRVGHALARAVRLATASAEKDDASNLAELSATEAKLRAHLERARRSEGR